jgi:Domain of unknown function (DUF2017)
MSRPFERVDDAFRVRLGPNQRTVIRSLAGQHRELLIAESPSSDPAVARLFPSAYPDDPLGSLEFEQATGDALLDGRLQAASTVESTTEADTLTEEQLLQWLAVVNDLRLVLGIRLEVTEETTEDAFAGDEARSGAYDLYVFLTWLESEIVEVLPVG